MGLDVKPRAVKRKNETSNPGKGAKLLKAKKEDAKNYDLNSQFKDLQRKYEALTIESKKKDKLIEEMKTQLKQFEISSKAEVKSSGFQTDFSCFSANCVRNVNVTCDFDEDFNCNECDFEASCKLELEWHMNANHGWPSPQDEEEDYDKKFICNMCGEILDTKGSLMNHRKDMHIEEVKLCSFFAQGSCDFQDDMCWYIHDKKRAAQQEFKCSFCEEKFKTKFLIMHHKKEYHRESVLPCRDFIKGSCRFESERCWFKHERYSSNNQEINIQSNTENQEMIKRIFT